MDFDHINGDKIAPISIMIHETWSMENIKKEIEKTELVCVLCHRTRTYVRQPRSSNKIIVRNYDFINSLKPDVCPICNQPRKSWQMEFDHFSGDKKAPVTALASHRYSLETIKKEIDKCQIICSLCHRRETFEEGGYRKWSPGVNST
jgi:L-lysine 2,3-aminomutase